MLPLSARPSITRQSDGMSEGRNSQTTVVIHHEKEKQEIVKEKGREDWERKKIKTAPRHSSESPAVSLRRGPTLESKEGEPGVQRVEHLRGLGGPGENPPPPPAGRAEASPPRKHGFALCCHFHMT